MAIKKEILDELLKDRDPKTMFSSDGLLGDEDRIDLAGVGKCEDLIALGPVILRTGTGLIPDSDDLIAGVLGEGLEVALLASTGLVGG